MLAFRRDVANLLRFHSFYFLALLRFLLRNTAFAVPHASAPASASVVSLQKYRFSLRKAFGNSPLQRTRRFLSSTYRPGYASLKNFCARFTSLHFACLATNLNAISRIIAKQKNLLLHFFFQKLKPKCAHAFFCYKKHHFV